MIEPETDLDLKQIIEQLKKVEQDLLDNLLSLQSQDNSDQTCAFIETEN